MTLLLACALLVSDAPPPITKPATPPVLKLSAVEGSIDYRINLRPGVTEPGTTVFVELQLAKTLEQASATYGRRQPIDDGSVSVVLLAPKPTKATPRTTPWVDHRLGYKLPDAGTYGVTFTPPETGVYTLGVVISSPSAATITYRALLPVGVWPIPEGTEPQVLPSALPAASHGNIANGKLLCGRLCRQNVAAAKPQGAPPTFIDSAYAAARGDEQLLADLVGNAALTAMERRDLLYYVHSLHWDVRAFFAEVAAFTPAAVTINDHGRDRLAAHDVKVQDEGRSGVVFVVYKGDVGPVQLIPYENRVARTQLNKTNKLGYLVFLPWANGKREFELAIALGPEPDYTIRGLRARDVLATDAAALNRDLQGLVGSGRFNDPKSLKGSAALRTSVAPAYLRAAELATMYYADEREFTAFDAEFND